MTCQCHEIMQHIDSFHQHCLCLFNRIVLTTSQYIGHTNTLTALHYTVEQSLLRVFQDHFLKTQSLCAMVSLYQIQLANTTEVSLSVSPLNNFSAPQCFICSLPNGNLGHFLSR